MVDPEILFGAAARRYCKSVMDEVVEEIKNGGLVPVDTGFLRDSYHAEETEEGAKLISDADYALDVEFGTRRGSPEQPHIRPALEVVIARHQR